MLKKSDTIHCAYLNCINGSKEQGFNYTCSPTNCFIIFLVLSPLNAKWVEEFKKKKKKVTQLRNDDQHSSILHKAKAQAFPKSHTDRRWENQSTLSVEAKLNK